MAKTMLQPKKDVLREQLALAAEEIIRLKTALAQWESAVIVANTHPTMRWEKRKPAPWWRRLLAWVGGPWA